MESAKLVSTFFVSSNDRVYGFLVIKVYFYFQTNISNKFSVSYFLMWELFWISLIYSGMCYCIHHDNYFMSAMSAFSLLIYKASKNKILFIFTTYFVVFTQFDRKSFHCVAMCTKLFFSIKNQLWQVIIFDIGILSSANFDI